MSETIFRLVAIAVLFHALAGAQDANTTSVPVASTSKGGVVVNGTYTNEFLNFSFPIPDGWTVTRQDPNADPLDGAILLTIEQQAGQLCRNRVVLSAIDARSRATSVQQFVSTFGSAGKDGPADWELLRDPFPVDFAGKHFFREDTKHSANGNSVYSAFICTRFRGFFLGWTVAAGSPTELEESARLLRQISFREDKAPRVRVSQGVATALLIKKVPPDYPADARRAHVQGQVVLQAEIGVNGEIRDLILVSGDGRLAPAACEAVSQWKYKPYLLNGQPVNVETQIIVNFTLSP